MTTFPEFADSNGRELLEGTKVYSLEFEENATVTGLSSRDGDVDGETGYAIGIGASMLLVFENGDEERITEHGPRYMYDEECRFDVTISSSWAGTV